MQRDNTKINTNILKFTKNGTAKMHAHLPTMQQCVTVQRLSRSDCTNNHEYVIIRLWLIFFMHKKVY